MAADPVNEVEGGNLIDKICYSVKGCPAKHSYNHIKGLFVNNLCKSMS